ncbi:MAG: DUF58 domain-containing protein [Syntrophomonadaceae bacterium]|nr:DUF58 domain-containing protein [Syntrophomonadaceae bacterium]
MKKYFDREFLASLERLSLNTNRIKAGINSGERRSPHKGHSVEFADFRNYVVGDDSRYIDWNSYARSEKLHVKLFAEEQDLLLTLFLDISKSMEWGQPSKDLLARQIAGALGYLVLTGYDRVSIAAFSDGLKGYLPPLRGRAAIKQIWGFIEGLACGGKTDFAKSMQQYGRYWRTPGISLVLTDFINIEDLFKGLNYLGSLKQEIILLQILSPDETDPSYYGDWRLIDCETGNKKEVTISTAMLNRYHKKLKSLTDEIKGFCSQRQIYYAQISSESPLEDIILRDMPRAGILK